jgi:hypothetical protein
MDGMIVTTAGRTNMELNLKAMEIADHLQIPYIQRQKRSITAIQNATQDDCLVIGKEKMEIYPYGELEPIFFHPNSAMFRIKRLQQGDKDPLIEATQLSKGKKFLDCTFGLGSDSITASYVVGDEGKVLGCEANRFLSFLMKSGLQIWNDGSTEIIQAMRRIKVKHDLAEDLLRTIPDNSYECVYFDPMFEENIYESNGIKGIKSLAIYDSIDEETIAQALRVAKERVVLKDHYRSKRFSQFGFDVQVRKTAKFHFGILSKKTNL